MENDAALPRWGWVPGRFFYALMITVLAGCLALPALAQNTVDYTFDELGRLKTVTYSNGVSVVYEYDAAGNRTQKTVTGSTNAPPPAEAVIVLPIAGFTVIPLL